MTAAAVPLAKDILSIFKLRIGAASGGAIFVWTSARLAHEPSRKRAIQNFLASLLQLVVLLGGAVADRLAGWH